MLTNQSHAPFDPTTVTRPDPRLIEELDYESQDPVESDDLGRTGAVPTTESSYRYQDNMHVRNGPPVACSAIGFGGTPSPAAPPPTTVLQAPVLLP